MEGETREAAEPPMSADGVSESMQADDIPASMQADDISASMQEDGAVSTPYEVEVGVVHVHKKALPSTSEPRKKKTKRSRTTAEDKISGYTLSAEDPDVASLLDKNGVEWLTKMGLSLNEKGEIRFIEGQALAQDASERITVISILSGKKLAGTAAPLAKNLLTWLDTHQAYMACTPEQKKKRTSRRTKQKRGPTARLSDAKRRLKRGNELLDQGRNGDALKVFSDAITSVQKIIAEVSKRDEALTSEISSLEALVNRPRSPAALALQQLTAQVAGQS